MKTSAITRALAFAQIIIAGAIYGSLAIGCSSTEPTAVRSNEDAIDPMVIQGAPTLSAALVVDPTPTPTAASGRVRAFVIVQNPTDTPVHIEHGACWLSLRLFASVSMSGTPLFESVRRDLDCTLPLYILDVPPHQSANAEQDVSVDWLHQSGIAAGTYFSQVVIKPGGVTTRFSTGQLVLP